MSGHTNSKEDVLDRALEAKDNPKGHENTHHNGVAEAAKKHGIKPNSTFKATGECHYDEHGNYHPKSFPAKTKKQAESCVTAGA